MSSMHSNEHRPYFVPGFGISRHIIFSHINFFLGPYASCRSYSYHGREGYLITAPGPQLTKVVAPRSWLLIRQVKSRSRIAADHDHRARSKICKPSRNSTSRQQLRGCGERMDLAPTITTSTNPCTCPKDLDTQAVIEAGELRNVAPHLSPPFPLSMPIRLHQSRGCASFSQRIGGGGASRDFDRHFLLHASKAARIDERYGQPSGDHYWSRSSPLQAGSWLELYRVSSYNLIL